MCEAKSTPRFDGELKIYNREDRLIVAQILVKNGYDVGQHNKQKTAKSLEYYLHYTANDGNADTSK